MEMSHRCANTICLFYFLYSLYNCFKFTHYSCRQWNNRPHSSTFSVRLSMLVNKDFSFSLYVFFVATFYFMLCFLFASVSISSVHPSLNSLPFAASSLKVFRASPSCTLTRARYHRPHGCCLHTRAKSNDSFFTFFLFHVLLVDKLREEGQNL